MRRAERVGREEDRERARRVLHEEVAIGDTTVEDSLREALIQVDVTEPGGSE